ncbi:MAG: endolytic transglycosylase MltG [Deltaproteobacteria bacterium]|nr:endolytic transglycosylase MltG [Deltaproteobacteria bacterium]
MRTASIILVAAALGLSAAASLYYFIIRPTPVFVSPRIVSIDKGESMTSAARRLSRSGIIANSLAFILYAELTGQARHVKPGDYAFKGGEGIPEILRHLVNGDFMVVTITIPEGMTVHQIGERLKAAGLACDSSFDRTALDGRLSQALGLGALGAEGFLFPATYRFSPLATSDQILAAMLERFYSVLTPQVEGRMFELGMSARQLVTMASIIEKEARVPSERPIIASVFYNRLALGMPLQSDPTAQYNYAGEIEPAAAAIRAPSAFNTYVIPDLPPGPIANPGLDSIHAALYPAHTAYLYFVARTDGTHIFSRSLKEHERAIAEVKRSAEIGQSPQG